MRYLTRQRFGLSAALVLLLGTAAWGQATRPTELAWPKTVDALAQALSGADASALTPLLAEGATFRTFGGKEGDAVRLLGTTAKAVRLGGHAYIHPPLVMAADISADFKTANGVPDETKRQMIPEDDAEMKRANATAVQWMADAVGAKSGMPVGVVVLWVEGGGDEVAHMLFVLVRGEEIANNQYRIKTIVYGDPLPQAQ